MSSSSMSRRATATLKAGAAASTSLSDFLLSPRKRKFLERTCHADCCVEDQSVPVVRYRGRGSCALLLLDLQEFQDRDDQPVWKRRQGDSRQGGGVGDGGRVRARRREICRAERRPAVQVQRGDLVSDPLRGSKGSRLFLGEARRGRRGRTVRLAEG